jgi:TfoX/Sxy family transcriptional regulator of competence genes
MSAEFDAVRALFAGREGIGERKMFGSLGVNLNGTGFVMEYKGKLIAKLGKDRVDRIVAEGWGDRFDTGSGRKMKEWIEVTPDHAGRWQDLAREAFAFVQAKA